MYILLGWSIFDREYFGHLIFTPTPAGVEN